jgi:Protein of unknown function (DUF1236)
MTKYRNTFLAGVAALALVAGAGVASAQYKDQNAASQGKAPQASTQTMKKGKGAMTGGQAQLKGKMHQNAQNATKGTEQNAKGTKAMGPSTARKAGPAEKGKQAREMNRGRKGRTAQGMQYQKGGATAQQQPSKKGAFTAQEQRRHGRVTTAQRREERNRLKGLQGNAAKPMQGAQGGAQGTAAVLGAQGTAQGTNVRLSERQRTDIRRTVIGARNAPRVGHVDFDVRVGTVIPRERIHIVPVPRILVRIEPRWRHFLYFIYEDEVVIVNPRDMRIVAILPA